MAAKKQPADRAVRDYIVFEQTGSTWNQLTPPQGDREHYTAATPKHAIRAAIADNPDRPPDVRFAAVPVRSWHEMRRQVKTVEQETWT